jgi:general secretion pathway protein B
MSFILDALKKSENDRQRQSAPALFEVKVAAPRRRFPLWAIGLGALLGINMLVLVWVLLRQPAPEAPATAAASPAPAAAAGAPNSAPPGMITVPATVTIPTTVNIPINSAPTVTMGSNYPESGVVAPSSAPPLAEEPLLSGQEPSVPPDYDARDYAPAITPAQANATAAARRAGGSISSRDEVLAQGTQLPELRLDFHVYDVDPAKKFVFINMRKLREGESLPEGVRVEAITQHGAQLSYRGTQFTLEGN